MHQGFALRILFVVSLFSQTCSAISIAVSGLPPDEPPSFNLTPAGAPSRVDVELFNTGGQDALFTTAQVALQVLPIGATQGGLELELDASAVSFFGVPAGNIATDPGAITAQVGALPPTFPSLASGARGLLAAVDVSAAPGTLGEFALVALPFDPVNFSSSSQFAQPGVLDFFPFENQPSPGIGGTVLATFAVVPEPSGVVLVAGACFGLGVFRRRNSCRSTQV